MGSEMCIRDRVRQSRAERATDTEPAAEGNTNGERVPMTNPTAGGDEHAREGSRGDVIEARDDIRTASRGPSSMSMQNGGYGGVYMQPPPDSLLNTGKTELAEAIAQAVVYANTTSNTALQKPPPGGEDWDRDERREAWSKNVAEFSGDGEGTWRGAVLWHGFKTSIQTMWNSRQYMNGKDIMAILNRKITGVAKARADVASLLKPDDPKLPSRVCERLDRVYMSELAKKAAKAEMRKLTNLAESI